MYRTIPDIYTLTLLSLCILSANVLFCLPMFFLSPINRIILCWGGDGKVYHQTPSMCIITLTLWLRCWLCCDPGSRGYFTHGIVTVTPPHITAQAATGTNAVSRKDER